MSGKDGLMVFRVKATLASGYSIIKATLAEDARKRKREGSRLWRIPCVVGEKGRAVMKSGPRRLQLALSLFHFLGQCGTG